MTTESCDYCETESLCARTANTDRSVQRKTFARLAGDVRIGDLLTGSDGARVDRIDCLDGDRGTVVAIHLENARMVVRLATENVILESTPCRCELVDVLDGRTCDQVTA